MQGFPDNCLNPAREETYRVLETIFDELIKLFPMRAIHVGADGRRYLVMHGDEFDVVVRYAKWLALLGDWDWWRPGRKGS